MLPTNVVFNGFSPHSLAFFEALAGNNSKLWFDAHRAEYERYLLEPLKALVTDLAAPLLAIDPELVIIPAVDKTISRIYRDTRFSRNKSPYKTCLWITFNAQARIGKQLPVSSSKSRLTVTALAWVFTARPGRPWTRCGVS